MIQIFLFTILLMNQQLIHCLQKKFLNLHEVLISPIIRIELLSFAGLEKEEEQAIKDLLSQFYSVPLLKEIEEQTIQLKRQYKIKLPDAIIAATALHKDAFLVTRNANDFQGIAGLKIENPFVN